MTLRGKAAIAFDASVTDHATVIVRPCTYNAFLVIHTMAAPTTGGYVTAEISPDNGATWVPHHGKGTNIKSADTNAGYACILEGITEVVRLTLHRTDGAHTVYVIPLEL